MKYLKKAFIIFFTLAIIFGCVGSVFAKKTLGDADISLSEVVAPTGIEQGNMIDYLSTIISALLTMIGLLFFVLMVYSGVKWFTSGGEEENVTKARKTLIGSIIGIVIVAASYALSAFVTSRLSGAPSETNTIPNAQDATKPGENQFCCIVPATSNFGSPYTASLRDPQTCWNYAVEAYPSTEGESLTKKASDKKGSGWEMYEEISDINTCLQIFECWDGGPYTDAGFDECIEGVVED